MKNLATIQQALDNLAQLRKDEYKVADNLAKEQNTFAAKISHMKEVDAAINEHLNGLIKTFNLCKGCAHNGIAEYSNNASGDCDSCEEYKYSERVNYCDELENHGIYI